MGRHISNEVLSHKLTEARQRKLPVTTPRDVRLPKVPNKALAVIGVRRGGKTSFLQGLIREKLDAGEPRGVHLLVSFEDERLVGITAEDVGWMLDEHARIEPALATYEARTLYLDEIQVVDGWATLVRRLLDTGDTRVFISGSSATLLSKEVATSMRGRALEVLIHPFSFRESLRHAGHEPTESWENLESRQRAAVDAALRTYMTVGGFPEAQGLSVEDRIALLSSYVDTMVLRDVIDRHGVSNVVALRQLQRTLLATPGGHFTVHKFHRDLHSQGVTVGENTLHDLLGYLQDAFLVRILPMHSASERQRNRNPRKIYPIDPGLIPVFERTGREHRGRILETAVLLELERRGYDAAWVRVDAADGAWEVDFHADHRVRAPLLIQVSLDTSEETTWEREVRALDRAASTYPEALPLLITMDPSPPTRTLPGRLEWRAASQWLLDG